MLVFSCFVPHPPLMVPGIGDENKKDIESTINAMEKISELLADTDPEVLIVISPHAVTDMDKMSVCISPKAAGNLSQFKSDFKLELEVDLELANNIIDLSEENDIEIIKRIDENGNYFLDHGVLAPLSYIIQDLGNVEIVPIGLSGLTRAKHFTFGQAIADAIEKSDKRIAIIASGDLSHRTSENNSAAIAGKKFEKQIVDDIENFNPKNILNIDEQLQEDAGECGYRSLLILLGILDGKKVSTNVLSHEAPFGVGYLVANFDIK